MHNIKCVLIADSGVGKTCLLISYTSHAFPEEYIPTTFETFCSNLIVDDKSVRLDMFDTHGHEEYDRLRPLAYGDADVFLLCFSVDSPISFEHVKSKWAKEPLTYCPKARTIVVGTKSDLREDRATIQMMKEKGTDFVSAQMGHQLAKDVNASKYVECSARTQAGVKEVFEEAVRAVFRPAVVGVVQEESCVVS